jgi:hypothetical protein
MTVIEEPSDVRSDGLDDDGRPKWRISGHTGDDMDIELICILAEDDRGNRTVFVTLYWD